MTTQEAIAMLRDHIRWMGAPALRAPYEEALRVIEEAVRKEDPTTAPCMYRVDGLCTMGTHSDDGTRRKPSVACTGWCVEDEHNREEER